MSSHWGQENDRQGFDAAVRRREDDHLDRWPFAHEIYSIATTGPKDWSVRLGVYGEWGTGKTSVLEFVADMAAKERHVVIWFNPWQYSSKSELWRAFVLTVFEELEQQLGSVQAARAPKRKALLEKAGRIVKSVSAIANEKAGKAVDAGLELVTKHFAFSKSDLASLQGILGDRRILVLVDDLDRTAPELVPEILFAFKELLDVPGFAFVCAFDPAVVGGVLGRYHPGFGTGLQFLEKIIDFPRWLPPPKIEGLVRLAVADVRRYCPYVPEEAVADGIQVLPRNPRMVRQFIRLLALLRPQIERHGDGELRWPVIVAANVIKVRFPQLAPGLLLNNRFWERIPLIPLMARDENERDEMSKVIEAHVNETVSGSRAHITEDQQRDLVVGMEFLCSLLSRGSGVLLETFKYQLRIAESPRAVTWKEYETFLAGWSRRQTTECIQRWISCHARKVERPNGDVQCELLDRSLERYAEVLRQVDAACLEHTRTCCFERAQMLISIIECFVLKLGDIDKSKKQLPPSQFERLFDTFAAILRSGSPLIADSCQRNETLLVKVMDLWEGDVTPLIDAVLPYGPLGSRRFDGPQAWALHERLSTSVLPKLAMQVIDGFSEVDYIQRRVWAQDLENQQIRALVLDHDGALWKGARPQLLRSLRQAIGGQAQQANVYSLFSWFDYILKERAGTEEASAVTTILSDKEMLDGLWAAATAKLLSPYATLRLDRLVQRLQKVGVKPELPTWWDAMVKSVPTPTPETESTT